MWRVGKGKFVFLFGLWSLSFLITVKYVSFSVRNDLKSQGSHIGASKKVATKLERQKGFFRFELRWLLSANFMMSFVSSPYRCTLVTHSLVSGDNIYAYRLYVGITLGVWVSCTWQRVYVALGPWPSITSATYNDMCCSSPKPLPHHHCLDNHVVLAYQTQAHHLLTWTLNVFFKVPHVWKTKHYMLVTVKRQRQIVKHSSTG